MKAPLPQNSPTYFNTETQQVKRIHLNLELIFLHWKIYNSRLIRWIFKSVRIVQMWVECIWISSLHIWMNMINLGDSHKFQQFKNMCYSSINTLNLNEWSCQMKINNVYVYYILCLTIYTESSLRWVHNAPVLFYRVSNMDYSTIVNLNSEWSC